MKSGKESQARFAALFLLSRIDDPEAHPEAFALLEEIEDRVAVDN